MTLKLVCQAAQRPRARAFPTIPRSPTPTRRRCVDETERRPACRPNDRRICLEPNRPAWPRLLLNEGEPRGRRSGYFARGIRLRNRNASPRPPSRHGRAPRRAWEHEWRWSEPPRRGDEQIRERRRAPSCERPAACKPEDWPSRSGSWPPSEYDSGEPPRPSSRANDANPESSGRCARHARSSSGRRHGHAGASGPCAGRKRKRAPRILGEASLSPRRGRLPDRSPVWR